MSNRNFKRIVLKLSGEALAGDQGFGINPLVVEEIAKEIAEIARTTDLQIAIVVGGGNIWRGLAGSAKGMDRASADYMGMIATVMNSLALQDALEMPERLLVFRLPLLCRKWLNHIFAVVLSVIWKKGRIVIFCRRKRVIRIFSTDTTAALRAAEIEADASFNG